jgi:hypothetical protein
VKKRNLTREDCRVILRRCNDAMERMTALGITDRALWDEIARIADTANRIQNRRVAK